jgi:exodeoxyribonuclease V alpha subunit
VETVEVEAEIVGVKFAAPDGDFAVLVALTDAGEEVVLTGPLAHVREGERVRAAGAWRAHPKHGEQLEVRQVAVLEPASEAALLAVLEQVRGLGARGAAWLLERHGGEVLEVIDRDPRAALRAVPGIGRARIGAAVRSWEDQAALRRVRLLLAQHGVDAAAAGRIVRAWGTRSVARLREDPYAVCSLPGVGFATADTLARSLGAAPDAPGRLRAGVLHALAQAEDDGHTVLPRGDLEERARRLLGAEAGDAIDELEARGEVVVDERAGEATLVAAAGLHGVEQSLAGHARRLLDGGAALKLRKAPQRPTTGAFVPTDDQWGAVTAALEGRLSILTGGPGTGKTATMRVLVDAVRGASRTARLCAPTGKAARRLTELTGAPASTIHRLLEWVPGEGPTRDADAPIEGCDVLIVDEASMLSVRLAEALLAAVGPRTHVLLVGDVDQLAPVGAGRPLGDLIASRAVPTTTLTEVFRQAARSLIVHAAHAVNAGRQPPRRHPDPDGLRDFYVLERDGAPAMVEEAVSLVVERLPGHLGVDATAGVQVLAPMHRGPAGIDALNERLRERLNPDGASIPGTSLRVQDKVLQTVNDHERELMNGEVGVLVSADPERGRALLRLTDGRTIALPFGALGTLRLAYAASVHKLQGSSSPAVVVLLARAHRHMLTRNLAYTAITRAERLCVLVAEPGALPHALTRVDAAHRHTRLCALVSEPAAA